MTDTAIARVEALAVQDDQPLIQERGFVIEWRPDHPIDESEYDRDYVIPRNAPNDVLIHGEMDPVDADKVGTLLADAADHDLLLDDPLAAHVPLDQGADADVVAEPAIVELDDGEVELDDDEDDVDGGDDEDHHNVFRRRQRRCT